MADCTLPSLLGRGFDPATKNHFNFDVNIHEKFCIPTFYAGNTMALLFFHEKLGKSKFVKFEVFRFSNFSKSFHGQNNSAIMFPA
jgi:hypothetical protein